MREFAELYRQYRADVGRWVAASGTPQHLRADVMQEIWITVFRRIDKLREHPKPRAWLRRVVEHHLLHGHRSVARQQRKIEALEAEPLRVRDAHTEMDEVRDLTRLLVKIPGEQREVFIRIVLYGETEPELASKLHLSVNTVHSRFWRAREHIKRLLLCIAAIFLQEESAKAAEASAGLAPFGKFLNSWPRRLTSAIKSLGLSTLVLLTPVETDVNSGVMHVQPMPARGGIQDGGAGLRTSGPTAELTADESEPVLPTLHEIVGSVEAQPDLPNTSAPLQPLPPPSTPDLSRRTKRSSVVRSKKNTIGHQDSSPAAMSKRAKTRQDPGTDLINRAIAHLNAQRPLAALEVLSSHKRSYPASALAVSREYLIQVALRCAGQDGEANAKLRENAREFPDARAYRRAALVQSR